MTTAYVWAVYILLFLSEVWLMTALGWSAWKLTGSGARGWSAAIATVILACVLWGLFAAPAAVFQVPAAKYAVKIALYAGATALLAWAGARTSTVIGFAAFSLIINALALLPPAVYAELW